MPSWIQNLNPAKKAKRRRMLAKIHKLAAERLAPTGDWKEALKGVVSSVTGGKTTSSGECYFDELAAILDHLQGKQPRATRFRERMAKHQTISQPDYIRRLIADVNATCRAYQKDFANALLQAKVGTDDPDLMTGKERRQAINILKSYL